jgi:PilZ domain
VERRSAVRYRLQIPVLFYWENAQGHRFQGEGITRDISEVGAYVLSAASPPLKSKVELEVMFPTHVGALKTSLRGNMQVLRLENQPDRSGPGFALAGTALAFCVDQR